VARVGDDVTLDRLRPWRVAPDGIAEACRDREGAIGDGCRLLTRAARVADGIADACRNREGAAGDGCRLLTRAARVRGDVVGG